MTSNQRWLERRATFRLPDEQIDTSIHEVAEIESDRVARDFVQTHHYSGSFPAARFRFGLYERGALVGVAVYSHPVRDEVLTNVFPDLAVEDAAELGRFVLLDCVAGNGETWFLARTFDLLRSRLSGIVSFSDPIERTRITGEVVMPGHVGTVYQASNAKYRGRGRKDTLRLLPDGRALSRRSYQKIRGGEKGWRAAAVRLVEAGADPLPDICPAEQRCAWLATWMDRLTRPLKHPGNHRYAWRLDARRQPHGPDRAFPKKAAA